MKKKKLLGIFLSVTMGLTAFTGCGSFTDSKSTVTAPGTTGAASTAVNSDVLSVYVDTEIKTLVQWAASENQAFKVINNISEGLYRLDENDELVPGLAEDCIISDDKLTYTFKLREGLKWSNGTPLTAYDFAFAWLKQMSSEETNGYSFILNDYIVNGNEYYAGEVSAEEVGIKVLDDTTLEVKIKTPTPYFTRLTVHPVYFPLNEEFVTAQGDQYALSPENMIYCGPYVLSSFDSAVGASFEKNAEYWDAENVAIEKCRIRIIKEAATALSAYQAGEISNVKLVSSDVNKYKDNPEFKQMNEFRTTYIQFNTTDEVLSNTNIRKALSLAIDRDTLVEVILADGSAPARGLVARGMYGDGSSTFRELNGDVTVFSIDEAKTYWAKGVEELGMEPQLTLLVPDDSVTKSVATYVQSEYKKNLGIDIIIDTKTTQARGALMDANDYQFAITGWGADYDDAMTYMDLWATNAPYRGNYGNEKYAQIIEQAKVETDEADRLELLFESEKLLVEEDAVVSPLYNRGSASLTKSNVENLVEHPFGPPLDFKYASFK